MWFLLSLLFSSTLVTAAPRHGLQHRQWHVDHKHGITLEKTVVVPAPSVTSINYIPPSSSTPTSSSTAALSTPTSGTEQPSPPNGDNTDPRLGSLTRMETSAVLDICYTCHNATIAWPLPATPNGVQMPMPVLDHTEIPQASLFARPESTPGMLDVHNYCSYDLHYEHLGGVPGQRVLPAGGSISEPAVGTVMKVNKVQGLDQPVQIEYGGKFYDISLIDCLRKDENGKRTADTSGCAGHEHGLQLSNPGSRAWQCDSGAWCDDQAYLYEENLCKIINPAATTATGDYSKGLTMEFCASLK